MRAVDRGQIPRAQYGALLIDEGHDFQADWLKLAVQMLDPETNSLLLLYDDAQSIYGQRRSSTFSFRSVGISASGRTKILKRNYRNTNEILECAREFAKEILEAKDADDDNVPSLMPESGGRSGPVPRFGQFQSTEAEANQIAQELLRLHRAGTPWREMGVFYTAPFVGQAVKDALDLAHIPVDWAQRQPLKKPARQRQVDDSAQFQGASVPGCHHRGRRIPAVSVRTRRCQGHVRRVNSGHS